MKKIAINVDIEPDLPQYLVESYLGLQLGLPPLLNIFEQRKTKVDFFITATICRKFPSLVDRLARGGDNIGNHGLRHELMCTKSYSQQLREIDESTRLIEKVSGTRPKMFRAPNFGANNETIRALEELGYSLDSSVLPGRAARKWKIKTLYDFRKAPRTPYNPSVRDIGFPGNSSLIEVPVTENPQAPGTPIGIGFLNKAGVEETMRAIRETSTDYAIFLIHPWECVDLYRRFPKLPKAWQEVCKGDLRPFLRLISLLREECSFVALEDIAKYYLGGG